VRHAARSQAELWRCLHGFGMLMISPQHSLGAPEYRPRAASSDAGRSLPYAHHCNIPDAVFLRLCYTLVLAVAFAVFDLHIALFHGRYIRDTEPS